MKTEFKGTKGKWRLSEKNEFLVKKEDDNYLAKLYFSNQENLKEVKYNALLISKSPEMLNMLIELVKQNEMRGYGDSKDVLNAKKLIKEATTL